MKVQPFDDLQPSAASALRKMIESLEPNANALNGKGFSWMLAAYLAEAIKSGKPDLSELRSNGVGEKTAVEICTAISKRHARRVAAVDAAPIPKQPAPKPAPKLAAPEMHGMTALSMFHTLCVLCEQGAAGQAPCLTTLVDDGWSPSTAKELVKVINAARTAR